MADFISFDEGANELLANGLPSTCYFALSTKPCSGTGTLVVGDTLAGGFGEITGTAYARQSQSEPSPSSRSAAFSQMMWDTGTAADWSSSVKSCVLVTTSGAGGKLICAWNLQAGGTARDLSAAHTQEKFTPTLTL